MKTNKEYPATHSMSTAWYVADEDGNVGILDFNENGPVPWGLPEECVENLVYNYEEDEVNNRRLGFALTDDQIDDLMEKPHSPEEEDSWWDCIIQIDTEKENAFLELAKNPDFDLDFCLSRERGLYSIDAYECTTSVGQEERIKVLNNSSLKKMIDQGIILKVYKEKDFWMNDEWVDDKIVHKKRFSSAPYYIFHQPYWTEELPVCMNIPNNPVKLDQIPEKLRERILNVPGRFKENERFQIAEWYPCNAYVDDTQFVDGCEYGLLPMSSGKMAYFNTAIIIPSCFVNYCSEKEKYGCKECGQFCYSSEDHCFTNQPTVLIIAHPLQRMDYSMRTELDIINWRSIWLPFLPKIPYKIFHESQGYYESYPSEETVSKYVNDEMLSELLSKNRKWLEDMVARFNPRVVILCEKVEIFLEKLYKITENQITINGIDYPMFRRSEIDNHKEAIERLALMPYQGEHIPHIISIEEMEKIKQKP